MPPHPTDLSAFSADMISVFERSLKALVFIPCRNVQTAKAIRAGFEALRNVYTRHKPELVKQTQSSKIALYSTEDLRERFPSWDPGEEFPITIALDSRPPYTDELERAVEMTEELTRETPTETPTHA